MYHKIKRIIQICLSIMYPEKCPNCGAYVNSPIGWCEGCLPMAKYKTIDLLLAELPEISKCIAVYEYEGNIRKIIKKVKFYKQKQLAVKLAVLISKCSLTFLKIQCEYVVPVPLSEERLRERGYNQTTLIFRQWAKDNNLMWMDALYKTRETIPQWSLTKKKRQMNVDGAYAVVPEYAEKLRGKKILLVDDIFTTGATIGACAKALKKCGVYEINSIVLASGAD